MLLPELDLLPIMSCVLTDLGQIWECDMLCCSNDDTVTYCDTILEPTLTWDKNTHEKLLRHLHNHVRCEVAVPYSIHIFVSIVPNWSRKFF